MLTCLIDPVYDISQYTELHPGGVQILRSVGGTNASAAFHEVGHSEDARATLQTFLVGSLEPTEEDARVRPVYTSTIVPPTSTGTNGSFQAYILVSKALVKRAFILVCMLAAAKFLWPEMVDPLAMSKAFSTVSSFWRGVVLSSAASVACFWIVGKEIGKSLDMTKDLRRYPPIMKPTKALRGPTKITRQSTSAIDSARFATLTLVERTQLTPDTYKFTLTVADQSTTLTTLPPGSHVQIRAQIDSQSITRSYTPTHISPSTSSVDLAIKIYTPSLMGTHLLSLPLGSPLSLRGPLPSFSPYHRFLAKSLILLAGGSGITPMFSLIKHITADSTDLTHITLLYASRTQGDILLHNELDALATRFPTKLTIHYFVSDSSDDTRRHIGRDSLETLLPNKVGSPGSKYLLCGPEGLVRALTGELVTMGCEAPRRFKHATDQVFVF
jgi:cytochrome-b5 reductase